MAADRCLMGVSSVGCGESRGGCGPRGGDGSWAALRQAVPWVVVVWSVAGSTVPGGVGPLGDGAGGSAADGAVCLCLWGWGLVVNGEEAPPWWGLLPVMVVRRCPTLPHSLGCSTIGAVGLSFRVRNGTGRFPHAMTAVTLATVPRPLGCSRVYRVLLWVFRGARVECPWCPWWGWVVSLVGYINRAGCNSIQLWFCGVSCGGSCCWLGTA